MADRKEVAQRRQLIFGPGPQPFAWKAIGQARALPSVEIAATLRRRAPPRDLASASLDHCAREAFVGHIAVALSARPIHARKRRLSSFSWRIYSRAFARSTGPLVRG
jgi:hypothetical protein